MFVLLLLAAVVGLASAQNSTFSPLRPPSIPLAVKSPFMNAWLPAGTSGGVGNGGYLPGIWPQFWLGQTLGWAGIIRVDGAPYVWMGAPPNMTTFATQTAFTYTSTRSIFTLDINGQVTMNVTFLSNVTPDDLLRSSLPYTYLDIQVESADGNAHDVQVYTDISGEWAAGTTSNIINWSYGGADSTVTPNKVAPAGAQDPSTYTRTQFGTLTDIPTFSTKYTTAPHTAATESIRASTTHTSAPAIHSPLAGIHEYNSSNSGIAYHQVFNANQEGAEYSSDLSAADWGYWYYTTANVTGLSYQSGEDVVVRGNFANSGVLPNDVDPNFRAIADDWPVFGFAMDFGNVTDSQNLLVMLSLHQKNCILFQAQNVTESDSPCLWNSYFDSDTDALQYFYADYAKAEKLADQLDDQVQTDAEAVGGSEYAAIAALAVRQAFGAVEYTNTPDAPYVFIEEISTDDNIQTVDIIFPFHPIALYLNPKILRYLLDPILINTYAGNWPYAYAPHDLGHLFPNATGYSNGENGGPSTQEAQPVEESGNMLIMALAYAQRTNDTAWLAQYYNVFKGWASYLTDGNQALYPSNQTSTDDFAGNFPNEVNLAVKGIIGLGCFAQIANLTGNDEDGANFTQAALSYFEQWVGLSTDTANSPPRMLFDYGDANTWTTLYNIFGDAVNGLGLVPQSIYDQQSTFYATQFNTYGVLLDNRPQSQTAMWAKADWEMFAASVSSNDTFNQFTQAIFNFLGASDSFCPFPDLYDVTTAEAVYGSTRGFCGRPVVGGVFAPLALKSAPATSSAFGN